ncbi:unnamed protein product [Phaeothamnion confervicola]
MKSRRNRLRCQPPTRDSSSKRDGWVAGGAICVACTLSLLRLPPSSLGYVIAGGAVPLRPSFCSPQRPSCGLFMGEERWAGARSVPDNQSPSGRFQSRARGISDWFRARTPPSESGSGARSSSFGMESFVSGFGSISGGGGGGGGDNSTDGGASSSGAFGDGDSSGGVDSLVLASGVDGGRNERGASSAAAAVLGPLLAFFSALLAPLLALLGGAWRGYTALLTERPLVTKAFTAGLIAFVGDLGAQIFEHSRFGGSGRWTSDRRRSLAVMIDGVFLTGPGLHFLYGLLEATIPTSGGRLPAALPAMLHVLFDTFVFDPMFVCSFFCMTGVLERRPLLGDVVPQLQREYWAALRGSWGVSIVFWPIQYWTFRYMPLQFRVMVVNLCDVCWTATLSFFSHRDEAAAGELGAGRSKPAAVTGAATGRSRTAATAAARSEQPQRSSVVAAGGDDVRRGSGSGVNKRRKSRAGSGVTLRARTGKKEATAGRGALAVVSSCG